MPQVIRAEHLGFCFGVRDALAAADQVQRPRETAILGELVHNDRVNGQLRERGFEVIAETDRNDLPVGSDVMVTAHGISDWRRDQLTAAGHRLIDTTCPLVRRVHDAARKLAGAGYFVIVIGKPNHVEVQGIVEDLPAAGHAVVDLPDAVRRYHAERIGLTAGTSTPDDVIDAVEARLIAIEPAKRTSPPRDASCRDWLDYFQSNLAEDPHIPWSARSTMDRTWRVAILRSIQTFQLGETGEGRHLLACARRWVDRGGDPEYAGALELFIDEEHRHAGWLAAFLEQEQTPLLTKQWSDRCFRFLRHLAGLRTSISVLVTAEILAQVFYLALLRATDSQTLRAICRRILRDERFHVVFQVEQMQRLSSGWSRPRKWLVGTMESVLFQIAKWVVWRDHRDVFAAAGMNRSEFAKRADRRYRAARRERTNLAPLAPLRGVGPGERNRGRGPASVNDSRHTGK